MDNPQLVTQFKFSGRAQDGTRAGVLTITKTTMQGSLVALFQVGLAESEVAELANVCHEHLNGDN